MTQETMKLIWIPSHVGIGKSKAANQAKEALNEEIGSQEPYPPQDLMKWMKKDKFMSRQKRWERGENDMKHREASVNWQNDTIELSWKEQVVIYRLRTGYTRATLRHIIEKTDIPDCLFCDVRLTTDHILCQRSEPVKR
jgi:hypothetical protein